jgi:hypothetical protein
MADQVADALALFGVEGKEGADDEDGGKFRTGVKIYRPHLPKRSEEELTAESAYAEFLEKAKTDPTLFARLCALDDAIPGRVAPYNADVVADQPLVWIATPEADERLEKARKELVLPWLKSRLTERAWCRRMGKHRTELARARELYFGALAERLNNPPPPVAVKIRNNGHVALPEPRRHSNGVYPRPPRPEPAPTFAPIQESRRIHVGPNIVVGVDKIAREIGETLEVTLRLIEGGSIHTGKLRGEVVAFRPFLPDHAYGDRTMKAEGKSIRRFAKGKIKREQLMLDLAALPFAPSFYERPSQWRLPCRRAA